MNEEHKEMQLLLTMLRKPSEHIKGVGIFNYLVDIGGLFLALPVASVLSIVKLEPSQTISFTLAGTIMLILGTQLHLRRMQARSEWSRIQIKFLRELMHRDRDLYERILKQMTEAFDKGQEI